MTMVLAIASAAIFAVLGLIHLVYTFRDFGPKPRYFRPRNLALLPAMQQTQINLAPGGRDYWSGILGFHLSHSISILLLALLIVLAADYQIQWLKPVLAAVGVAYAVIAWRCWFRIPMLGAMLATALMVLAWIV